MTSGVMALIIFFTGIITVFAVLALLVFMIEGYSYIVRFQYPFYKKHNKNLNSENLQATLTKELDPQIIAVISAAIYSEFYTENKKIKILEIVPQLNPDMAWRNAGIAENTRPFKI